MGGVPPELDVLKDPDTARAFVRWLWEQGHLTIYDDHTEDHDGTIRNIFYALSKPHKWSEHLETYLAQRG